jgi:hypothetical protein
VRETFDNTEIFTALSEINKYISDSDAEKNKVGENPLGSGIQPPSNTILQNTRVIIQPAAELETSNPLFALLYPNIYQDDADNSLKVSSGPVIGYAFEKGHLHY